MALLPVVTGPVALLRAVESGTVAPDPWALAATADPNKATTRSEKPVLAFIANSAGLLMPGSNYRQCKLFHPMRMRNSAPSIEPALYG
jgi:hypothetical protein